MDFKFDLEHAAYELEQIDNLLDIFNEFIGDELPVYGRPKEGISPSLEMRIFCDRLERNWCLTVTAIALIRKIHDDMTEAIEKYYSEQREKKGGDAA